MKYNLLILLTICSINLFGQKKYPTTSFNNFVEVEGTSYVIAEIDNRSKTERKTQSYLLFLNTEDGTTNQVVIENHGFYTDVKQVKIDELDINSIIVSAKTFDFDGKKGIDWSDPIQLFVISVDGKNKNLLTPKDFSVRKWAINKHSGTVVVTGFYDLNRNGKIDDSEVNEIQIYDLKTLKLQHKI